MSPARASTFARASVLGGRDIDRHRDTEVRSASPWLVYNALGAPIAPGLYQVFSARLGCSCPGARLVERTVDQVLIVAEDPRSAAMTALRLVESVDRECNAEASERRPTLRDIAGADAVCPALHPPTSRKLVDTAPVFPDSRAASSDS